MATGFPVKANYATGDVLTATNMNDLSGTVNYLQYMTPRNACLNSNFSVWQRGTSFSIAASAGLTYTADRWFLAGTGASQAMTISRQATGDTTNLPNIQYCVRVQRNSGQTGINTLIYGQSFESVNSIPFAGKQITVSFYARAGANYSAASGNLAFQVVTGTGTDQNPWGAGYTGVNVLINSANTLTTTWQRFTATATIPATATEISVATAFVPVGTAGAADYYEITGVQLELGSVANTYMPNQPTYQGELAACQRYYQKSYDTGTAVPTNGTTNGVVFAYSTATASAAKIVNIALKSEMRTTPTVTIYSFTSSTAGKISDADGTDLAVNSGIATHIGTRSFSAYNNSGGAIIPVSGGFIFHYQASAEL